jgi:hypothetical protein
MEYKAGSFLLSQVDEAAAARKRQQQAAEQRKQHRFAFDEHGADDVDDELVTQPTRDLDEVELAERFRAQQERAVKEFSPNATLFLFLLGIGSACTAFFVDHSVKLLVSGTPI